MLATVPCTLLHKDIRQRFFALNRHRLGRVRESLRPRQRVFLDALPLLFHTNHPLLPGFSGTRTPCGISNYSPPVTAIRAGQSISKGFSYKKWTPPIHPIYGLFLMGSSGTVAQSKQSDFDIWVCCRPGLPPTDRKILQDKSTLIEAWAANLGIEVHFFLVDEEEIREGHFESLSRSSSGSAQRYLLLDEFYRTGLLVAGRSPLWWLIPPEYELHYENLVQELSRKHLLRTNDYLDFGGIPQLPAAEFSSAALWQLNKAIDSPYKSLLKLLLMECYASEYPHIDLLCRHYKRAVYAGKTNLDELDPYVMMLHKVETYLQHRGETERLELARCCFYFKANEPLSRPGRADRPAWRRQLLRMLSASWGWDQARLLQLDSRSEWKSPQVMKERQRLVDQLTHSYRQLSHYVGTQAKQTPQTQRDLHILGRKLYAAFGRKTGKIEYINLEISSNLREEWLSLYQLDQPNSPAGWILYQGRFTPGDHGGTALKHGHNVTELLVWAYFNGLISHATHLAAYSKNGMPKPVELQALQAQLQKLFPHPGLHGQTLDNYTIPPTIERAVVFINVGIDPMAHRTRQGIHLTSTQADPLSYGGARENLALSLEMVLLSSWKEVLVIPYRGSQGILDCLSEYLRWAPLSEGQPPPALTTGCYSTSHGRHIAERIEILFQNIVSCYYQNYPPHTRYVLGIGQDYFILWFENDSLYTEKWPSREALLKALGRPQPIFTPVVLDRHLSHWAFLHRLFEANLPGQVQCFYRTQSKGTELFILDERGSLFHQIYPETNAKTLLAHYSRFLDTTVERLNLTLSPGHHNIIVDKAVYYRLRQSNHGPWILERMQPAPPPQPSTYFQVQVLGDVLGNDKIFTVFCDNREFSAFEYGADLYREVAHHILRQRSDHEPYPIYITDLDLSPALLDRESLGSIQTVHLLNYKRVIEDQLNQALAELTSD
ncbi:Adenylate cyclase [Nitrosococcus halophilus Nc 4]|uniref:Adenylate cyclase n=1 Tax=Nitrosococcus halophilus (strain Nc4) TaxID=472759 RepID=D5C200_NITHN|nr:class I adenylate cyclase [Nitrosococcus halophilus]ADE16588.1 Adenylate cyclase [Nitrosococcus halophilus Nc 4]